MIDRVGTEMVLDRMLFTGHLDRIEAWPDELDLGTSHFVLFLALDGRRLDDGTIRHTATQALRQGAVYVCAWGPDCSRVHDLFDATIVTADPELRGPLVMTTWHDDESLDEALWFAVFSAFPGDELIDCGAVLGVAVANPAWGAQIRRRLSDPNGLDADVAV